MKLYTESKDTIAENAIGVLIKNHKPDITQLDNTMCSLEQHVDAYLSISNVYDVVSQEHFDFIDKSNYVLYNEYIKTITSNLNIKPVTISQEAIETIPSVVLNHHISLEGLIGDMWEKIKTLFTKVYEGIKKFFTTYFTQLGRLKKKLANLKEVLEETDKDIKNLTKPDVPGNITSKYPYSGTVDLNLIQEIFNNINTVTSTLVKINSLALKFADKEILDSNFISKVKTLRELASKSNKQIEENNQKKGINPLSKNNRDLRNENKSLKEIADSSEKEASDTERPAIDIGNDSSNTDVEFDDKEFILAKKEFNEFIKEIEKEMNGLKNKNLINGLKITNIEVKEDSGIDFQTEVTKETPNLLNLSSKTELLNLINDTIKMVDSIDKVSDSYSQINDNIMKNMNNVDKIIREIDGIKIESLGKYKTVLTNKVRERLKLMKTFFSQYNKVNKSLFGYVIDTAEGNVAYTLISLKNFG